MLTLGHSVDCNFVVNPEPVLLYVDRIQLIRVLHDAWRK